VPGIPDEDLTIPQVRSEPASPKPRSGEGGTPSASTSRFAPGSIIAGRYRLVALLGRGGMGEVYRADDLTLDQPVALKFLPEGAGGDQAHLAQFHNELRTARQVSHKNVCRLYDLGEANGRRFLTMEYVDGEDLASLLRRIGRIPQGKAIELARSRHRRQWSAISIQPSSASSCAASNAIRRGVRHRRSRLRRRCRAAIRWRPR